MSASDPFSLKSTKTQEENKKGQRTHQPRETLEGSWDTDVRVDLNEDVLGSVDVHLQETGLVQRAVQKGKKTLYTKKKEGAPLVSY